jgi:hypothetical protein
MEWMEAFRDQPIYLVSGTESLLPDEANDRSVAQSGLKTKCSRRADATPACLASQRLPGVAAGELRLAAAKRALFSGKIRNSRRSS